jgi:hypothetical protein
MGVWEWQKRGALHLHAVVLCPSSKVAQQLKTRWKDRWIKILDAIAKRSQVDMYARSVGGSWSSSKWRTRVDAQTVEKSVGNYLSKYLSKGSATVRKLAKYAPSSWYFVSTTLRDTIRLESREVSIEGLSPAACLSLRETIGGLLVAAVKRAYPYVSPYDRMVTGLIALASPIQASMLFDYMSPLIRLLEPLQEGLQDSRKLAPHVVSRFFSGQML